MMKRLIQRHGASSPLRSVRLGGLVSVAVLMAAVPQAAADLSFCARTDLRLRTNTPHSLAVADFYPGNGPDLAISFGASRKLSLWRNDGSGNFTETDVLVPPPDPDTQISSLVMEPQGLIARDFNDDGLVDIAGANRTVRYFAYMNPGTPGAWGAPAETDARNGYGNVMTSVSWNGDAALDIVTAQDSGVISIALGEVDGGGAPLGSWGIVQRFTTTATVGVFTDVDAANFIDLPAESGIMDVMTVDNQNGQLVIWPGDPARPGHVLPASVLLVPVTDAGGADLAPIDAIVDDWDGDGLWDALVTTTEGVVLWYRGNGAATAFDAPIRQDFVAGLGVAGRMPSDWSGVQYADVVGNDGIRDLVITDAGEVATERGFNWLTVIRGVADAPQPPSFDVSDQQHFAMGNLSSLRPGSLGTADFDQDGDQDIIALLGDQASLAILRSDGGGTFDAPLSFSAGATQPRGADAGRLTADSFEDVVTVPASPSDSTLRAPFVFPGLGTDELGSPLRAAPSGVDSPQSVLVGQVNTAEDAFADVIVTHAVDQSLYEGRGDGTFGPPGSAVAPGRIQLAQIHGGPEPDVAVVDRAATSLRTYEGDGRGAFTLRQTFVGLAGAADVTVGPFFTSGPDIVVAGSDAAGIAYGLHVLRWNAATSTHDAPAFLDFTALGMPPIEVKFLEQAQLDGSGPPEIVAVSTGGDAYVLRVSGSSFLGDAGWSFGNSAAGVVLRDLSADGVADLAVADANSVRVREGLSGGTFGTLLILPSNISNDGLAAADLDDDGLPELVAVSRYTSDLTVFCNASVGALILRVGRPAAGDLLNWPDLGAGVTVQIASGTLDALWANENLSDATCLASPAGNTYDDVRPLPAPVPPTSRAGYYYLLKCSGASCSEPDFGTLSDGVTPRFGPASPGAVPDPCP